MLFSLLAGLSLVPPPCRAGEVDPLAHWPAGASPRAVGTRVAERFANRPFDFEHLERRRVVNYPEVCAWYGALRLAQLTQNDALRELLVRKFDYFLTPAGQRRISRERNVDYSVFGAVPLALYQATADPKFLAMGRDFADRQWTETTPDGISTEARYWIDDMYMITLLQVQAFRGTGDICYLDRTARAMSAYLERLQQPNGLFFHAPDSPFYWSRGNGWMAAGMTELLSSLPADHPDRPRILAGYRKMMTSLLKAQGENGLWPQLVDRSDVWSETSGTGMFAFAFVTGVKQGWLPSEPYAFAARKAWLGLVSQLDEHARLREVCQGTNTGFHEVGADADAQLKYYRDRSRIVGDLHGEAPLLWTAAALLQ